MKKKLFLAILLSTLVGQVVSSVEIHVKANDQSNVNLEVDREHLVRYKNYINVEDYHLVWQEEFETDTLDRDVWNVELHEPGWVNAELQAYIDDESVLKVRDGQLVIQPVKTEKDGQTVYYSGRVNTQNKQNFKYGFFEARVKVPKGKGYLPAFWLMSADESIYGQWPRCGEIDIMEVHGSDTTTSYGTIHYGNPHRESQGKFILEDGDFSQEYHTFALEWLPGQMKWFVDGQLIHSESDWYSRTEGQGEITYPAPFDSEFYIILNLAVGGSWVGYPDETTEFDNQSYNIDYVRAYQLEDYDENVEKPVKPFSAREADQKGNYILNGDFVINEPLDNLEGWEFLTALNGEAEATIDDGILSVMTNNAGEVDYSVQLVQAAIPFERNYRYQLAFTAWSDEIRIGKVAISGPDNGYIRYLEDELLELSQTPQNYQFDFVMNHESDENGRLEFNMGAVENPAIFHLKDVSIKRLEKIEVADVKHVLSDGNYVYNGKFQEGERHLGYWEWSSLEQELFVSSLEDGRRLVILPNDSKQVTNLFQNELTLPVDMEFELSFDLASNEAFVLPVTIANQRFDIPIIKGNETYRQIFSLSEVDNVAINLNFAFENHEEVKLDNVKIQENSLIKNGSFNGGLTNFNAFIDGSAHATVVVDSLNEENAVDYTIFNTGDQAWKIQLIQENIPLLKDQHYRLQFKAKSSLARKIMFTIQRDGKVDNHWTPYFPEEMVELTPEYQEFSIEFTMNEVDDLNALLSISLGAVEGKMIEQEHRVVIDEISLELMNGID